MNSILSPRLLRLALLVQLGLASIGCQAAPYLYDAAGDTRAQKVQEAFGKIDLGKDVKATRGTVDIMRTELRSALEDSFAKQRDERLAGLLDPASDEPLERRLFLPVTGRVIALLDDAGVAKDIPLDPPVWKWTKLAAFGPRVAEISVAADASVELLGQLAIQRLRFNRRFKISLPEYDGTAFGDEIRKDKEGQPVTKMSLVEKDLGEAVVEATPLLKSYAKTYDKLHAQWAVVRKTAGENGLVRTIWAEIEAKRSASLSLKADAKEAAAALEELEKQYQKLADKPDAPSGESKSSSDSEKEPTGKDRVAQLQKRAEEISKAIDEAPDFLKEKLLPERIADIDTVLTAFAQGKEPKEMPKDETVRRATVVVAALPSLLSDAGKLAAGSQRPELVKLVFERARLGAQVAGIRKQRQRSDDAIAHLQRQLEAGLGELQQYQVMIKKWLALRDEAGIAATSDWTAGYADLRSRAPEGKAAESAEARRQRVKRFERLNAIITAGLLAVRRDQFAMAAAGQDLVFLQYEGAIDSAENAIVLWNTLLAEPINQLAGYYAAGVKPAEAAGLATQLIGLGAIAWRIK